MVQDEDKVEEVIKIDEVKLKRIQKKIQQFYVLIYFPNEPYLMKLEALAYESVNARLRNKKIRFFKMNYLENRDYVRSLNLKTLPAIILFDDSIPEKKIVIDDRLEAHNLVRFAEKANGNFDPVMINSRFQVNDSTKKNKKMMILLNPKIEEMRENYEHDKLINMFMRYSVIAGYDYFHLCNENFFFDELIASKNKDLKFTDDTFHFLTGFIKNDTTKIIYNEPLINTENPDIFVREFNHFSLNIADFEKSDNKEKIFFNKILFKKSNIYSTFGESDLNNLVKHGLPTVIIVCPKKTLTFDPAFHRDMYNYAQKFDGQIKFYFSTEENISIINLLNVFNLKTQPPYMFLIEKSNPDDNYFIKYIKKDIKLEIGEIKSFINDYQEKKLPLYFVSENIPTYVTEIKEFISENVTRMLEEEKLEYKKMAEDIYSNITMEKKNLTKEEYEEFKRKKDESENLRNNTSRDNENQEIIIPNNFTNEELNSKYLNKGENFYKIVGNNFADFLYDNKDKVVAMFGCSSPMYFCDLTFVRMKIISRLFSKHLDKIVFCITDPNKNEYIIQKPNTLNNTGNPNDFYHYNFDIIYPAFVTLDPVHQQGERNEILIKKIQSVKNFENTFRSRNIINFLLERLNMTETEAGLDMDYLKSKDFSRPVGYTDEYDFDDEKIEEIKKQKRIDSIVKDARKYVNLEESDLRKLLEMNPNKIDEFEQIFNTKFDPKKFDPNDPDKQLREARAQKGEL